MRKIYVILFLAVILTLSAQVVLDERYHTYQEILDELDSLQTNYSDIVKVEQIGTTLGAIPYQDPIPIMAIKLSNNANVDEDEPSIMYAGQCHAEEILGVEITMHMINDIIENRQIPPYSVWLDNLEIWFVPTYNPEGLQVVMDGWDVTFRKNKRDNNLNGIFDYAPVSGDDIDGVDLNRNYGFNWIHGDPFGVEGPEEWNDYYRGPDAFSEGGTQAIRELAAQQHFIYSINWHSSRTGNYSEKVKYPFNWNDAGKYPPDYNLSETIGETVADLIVTEAGTATYEPAASQGRKGLSQDWFYKEHGTIQLLIECGTQNLQPNNDPPLYLVDDTCERCSIGAYWLLDRALGYNASGAMLTGHVTDANTGEPLVAEIIVEEVKASYFTPRMSDELYGRFWRPLMPGTYSIRVIKKGYEEQLIENLVVNNSLWLTENVQLQPLATVEVSGTVTANGNPTEATIIVENGEYIPADIISVTSSGTFNFENFEGEHQITTISDGFVPTTQLVDLTAGVYDLDIDLQSSVEVLNQDWETGLSNWDTTGDWAITSNSYSGDNAVTDSPEEFYDNSTSASITSNSINLNGVGDDAVLTFWHKYQTEHDFDFCLVEYSTNGNDWNSLREFSGRNMEWHQELIFIPDLVDNNIYLRFTVDTDESIDDPGWWIDEIKILSSVGASIEDDVLQDNFKLHGNYPNPFNPSSAGRSPTTTISFSLNSETSKNTVLSIYNLKGQKIRTLLDEDIEVGQHNLIWNGLDNNGDSVTSGIYFYMLSSGKYEQTKKMILIK